MATRFPEHALRAPRALSGAPEVSAAPRRGQRARGDGIGRGTLLVTAVAVLLGVYLAAQWQSRPRPPAATPEYRREVAAATIQRLEAEQSDLKKRIGQLRQDLAARQQTAAAGESNIGRLNSELEQAKLSAGTVPVGGPGLRLLLDDSAAKTIPPKEDPAMYIVHEYQLRDIVNVLWAAGAEAISINGERIVGATSIYCVGSTILVNDTRTSPPYEFLVIGDPARLEAALGDAQNLKALKSRVKLYGLQFDMQKPQQITVPAYTGGFDVRHVDREAHDPAQLGRSQPR